MRAFVAFDLDGVLFTAEPFLGDAYRDAIAAVEKKRPGSFPRVPTTREILDHVGWPVPVILQRLFPHVDAAAVALLYDETLHVIGDYVARRAGQLFDGVRDTLAVLAAERYAMAIVSNGRRAYIEAVTHTYDLTGYFWPLITIEDEGIADKAGVLRAYLERHARAAADTVMVGDRASDVDAARAVHCRFVGCDYGHGYASEISGAGPLISNLTQLPGLLAAMFDNVVALPSEPNVFECRLCHKVFDARRRNPPCPECDSEDVELVSTE